jgi:hypothetical protein
MLHALLRAKTLGRRSLLSKAAIDFEVSIWYYIIIMTSRKIYDKYSEFLPASSLEVEDLDQVAAFLERTDPAEMAEWIDQRTVSYTMPGSDRAFRMIVDRPVDGDDTQAVVVGGEYGNGIGGIALGAALRARVVRDMVAPHATLMIQPNPALGQFDNMNYSAGERRQLRQGELAPILGRYATVLQDNLGDPQHLTFYGPSQGGGAVLGYAARSDTPAAAVAVVETPNVATRSYSELASAFMASGGQLQDIVRENYANLDMPLAREGLRTISALNLGRALIGFAHRDNLAMAGVLRRNSAQEQIARILNKDGSVVQAYGTASRVSSQHAALRLARLFADNPRYRSVRLEGADHSITNQYALNGALTRMADRLVR